MMPRTRFLHPLAALLLAGCTVGPDWQTPVRDLPPHWQGPAAAGAFDPTRPWWESFGDPQLTALVERALAQNPGLAGSRARVLQARALAAAAGSQLWPKVDLSGQYSYSHFSENGFLAGLGPPGGGGFPGAVAPGQEISLYQGAFDASWEIDLFGGRRRAIEAADADVQAAQADARAANVSLAAEVVADYLRLRSLQERLQVAERTAQEQQATTDVIAEQRAAGVAADLDLARAKSQLGARQARLPQLRGEIEVARRELDALLGADPGTVDADLLAPAPAPAPPDALAADVPAAVIRSRPDVFAAECRLHAATARVGEATADLYPSLSLTGVFGLQSQKPGEFASWDSRYFVLGPSLRWPLLDFGRVRAQIDVQDAGVLQARAEFAAAVVRALTDVEVALVQVQRERERGEALAAARDAAGEAVAIARERHTQGTLEYLDLLDAERTLDQADDDLAQSRLLQSTAVVSLYKALGGGS
jgi:NodT family efflux transporter outer membrane factor (OMF) lipoprotein